MNINIFQSYLVKLLYILITMLHVGSFTTNFMKKGNFLQTTYKNLMKMQQDNISTNIDGRKTSGVIESKQYTGEKIDNSPPKGTRDFYPQDHRQKQW